MIVPSIMSDEEVVGTPAPGWQLGRGGDLGRK